MTVLKKKEKKKRGRGGPIGLKINQRCGFLPDSAATVVGIPTNGRYTDHFQDSVFFTKVLL